IVPCYRIEDASQRKSAVDRTPLHTRFIKSNLKEYQKQEVRLLKQFLRGIGCYGAEAEIQGFSGYLCELLIIKYDNFRTLLSKVKNWRYGETIKFYDNAIPSFDTPLIVIDPVDKDRNAAAAVSKEKFDLFTIAAREYLEKPRVTFFFPNPVIPWSLKEIGEKMHTAKYIGIRFRKPDILSENLYPQIRKTMKSIRRYSEKQGFKIHDIKFHINKYIYIIVKTDVKPLSETFIQQGPPVNKKVNVKEFIDKWQDHPLTVKQPYEENNRLYVEIKRRYRELKSFLTENLSKMPLGKNIEKEIKEEYEILEDEELLLEELRIFWTQYFDQKYPWER
ncbi:MAG TPA: CCA tRNA nucleotidyltransferase, partial [Thermoplasmatales archaeon]|nr:CCA tRNA nucleotidyltransferase [Thermoplasmatales archaeon]